jgi:hypothetical protein
LFTRTTGYIELDKRIAWIFKNCKELLTVLESPAVPLHNNGSEIAVREGVLEKKISYGTRSDLGGLRDCQFEAIANLEESLIGAKPRALI